MANDVRIVITADGKQAQQEMGKIEGAAKKVGGAFGDMAKIAGGFVIGQALTSLPGHFSNAVGAASNLNEALSKSNTIFGENGKEIEKWASGAATDFGQSKSAALDAAGSFGNMFTQLGIGTDVAADMSMAMVELASDFASFHNADITEVVNAQSAAFRGEYDALQRFVPTINAAAVETEALAMTGKTLTSELTLQEKALAVQSLMMKGAGEAMGDFDRTSEGAANQQRILKAQLSDVQAEIGNAFLPAVVAIGKVFVEEVVPAIRTFVDEAKPKVKEFFESVKKFWEEDAKPAIDNLQAAWEEIWPVIKPIMEQIIAQIELIGTVFGNTVGIIVDLIGGDFDGAWKKAQNILDAFKKYFEDTFNNLIEFLKGLFGALKQVGQDLIGKIKEGVVAAGGALFTQAKETAEGVIRSIWQGLGDVWQLGADIVKWLARGIRDMAGDAIGAAGDLAGSIAGKLNPTGWVGSPKGIQNWFPYYFDLAMKNLAAEADSNPSLAAFLGEMKKKFADMANEAAAAAAAAVGNPGSLTNVLAGASTAPFGKPTTGDITDLITSKLTYAGHTVYGASYGGVGVSGASSLSALGQAFAKQGLTVIINGDVYGPEGAKQMVEDTSYSMAAVLAAKGLL